MMTLFDKNILQNICSYNLNLLAKFCQNDSKKLILLQKEPDNGFSSFACPATIN